LYSRWCESYGEQPFPSRLFGMRMKERGIQQKRGTAGVRQWAGLTLTEAQKLVLGKLP